VIYYRGYNKKPIPIITKNIIDKHTKDEIVLFIPYLINFLLIGSKIIEKIKEIKIYANMKLSFQKRNKTKSPKKIVKKLFVLFFMFII
jgi:hypothetical protein